MVSLVYLTNKKNGTVYVYINEKVYDEDKRKEVYRRRCVGHVDPKSGKVLPNRAKKLSHSYSVESIGLNLLFGKLSSDIGLTHALKIAFSEHWARILACAMYCVCSKEPLSEMTEWSKNNENPTGKAVTPEEIKELMASISNNAIDSFFKIWNRKLGENDAMMFSMRCIDSYNRSLEESRFGVRLSQESFVSDYEMCYGKSSRLPIAYHYRSTPLTNLQETFDAKSRFPWMDMGSYTFLLSPESFTDETMKELLEARYSYIAEIPNTADMAKDAIRRYRRGIVKNDIDREGSASERFYATIDTEIDGRIVHQHLFYDIAQEEMESAAFMNLIDKCRKELEDGIVVVPHWGIYERYYTTVEREDGTVFFDLNAERIMEATESAGFKMVITDSEDGPVETTRWFDIRSDTSSLYDNLKNNKDNSSLRLYLAPNSTSRDFIQFIALILRSALRRRMSDTKLSDFFTAEDVIAAMSTVHRIRMDNRKGAVTSEMNDDQEMIVNILGLE